MELSLLIFSSTTIMSSVFRVPVRESSPNSLLSGPPPPPLKPPPPPLKLPPLECSLSAPNDLNRLIGDDDDDEEEAVDIYMFEKMVKVGLLCIQNDPEARPSMRDVILMLEGTTDIPIPPSPVPRSSCLLSFEYSMFSRLQWRN
ncbi:putative non-specific serine/threonine protein kinase [Helianthus annuus]|uniref:Non-specific serine/threonine protein kinase n=2 Tax=Helianthus annuus TaxID=4232 RepID=A0A9K3JKZ3_HELAN|nr:putative non-specific serine/threonine protein kinase [Helianthus annuus]KAJ0594612.1 putative non-specific serine/threonine protein kinase [Helianthus annuus]KAJ0609660.1 putative non-specific serine/threonine protein kinase [Helianthus annuus]KAJ0769709.1 putative non-specific serine/threonine protein kinase [Helianthus annuus]KAJ0775435.1 putative non-specific serine/threonine protein kinase [Helianthus annuus]